MAELAAGPHATGRITRDRRSGRTRPPPGPVAAGEATFEPLAGRNARGRRAVDLYIAATAVAAGLPLYTRNPDDFAGLSEMLESSRSDPVSMPIVLQPSAHASAAEDLPRYPERGLADGF